MLDNPPIVDVLEDVTRDLLLVTTAPSVGVPDGIDVGVGVEPAGFPRGQGVGVSQGDLGTVGHMEGLTLGQGSQTSLHKHRTHT